jgi:hypothetical protein
MRPALRKVLLRSMIIVLGGASRHAPQRSYVVSGDSETATKRAQRHDAAAYRATWPVGSTMSSSAVDRRPDAASSSLSTVGLAQVDPVAWRSRTPSGGTGALEGTAVHPLRSQGLKLRSTS